MLKNKENKIYVVKRPLKSFKSFAFTTGQTARSALLVYIQSKFTLVEYMDDGYIYTYDILSKDVKEDSLYFQGYYWDKQKNGATFGKNIKKYQQIAQQMEKILLSQKYSLFNYNRYIAQESIRFKFGLAQQQNLSYEAEVKKILLEKRKILLRKLQYLQNNLNDDDYEKIQMNRSEISRKIIRKHKENNKIITSWQVTYNVEKQKRLKPAISRQIDIIKEQINILQNRLSQNPKKMTYQDIYKILTIQNCV